MLCNFSLTKRKEDNIVLYKLYWMSEINFGYWKKYCNLWFEQKLLIANCNLQIFFFCFFLNPRVVVSSLIFLSFLSKNIVCKGYLILNKKRLTTITKILNKLTASARKNSNPTKTYSFDLRPQCMKIVIKCNRRTM